MDSKSFLFLDIVILAAGLVNYGLTQMQINASYSTGYHQIWVFYTV